jgi:general stress protein YciG
MSDDLSEAAANLGRKGGQARTPAKARSSKENGKKGGRPKKDPSTPSRVRKKKP